MPEEWERKGWAAPQGGWPKFDENGRVVREDEASEGGDADVVEPDEDADREAEGAEAPA